MFMVVKKVNGCSDTVFKGSLKQCEDYIQTLTTPTSKNYNGIMLVDGNTTHYVNKVW